MIFWMMQINRGFARSLGRFDRLPTEIKLIIFMAMDIRTLEISRSVCRDWDGMIVGSPSLQHKIELAISGVGQAPPTTTETLELSKRTDVLRAHRAAWRKLDWHEFRTISAARVRYPDAPVQVLLRENVFAQKGWKDSNIYLTGIPSRRLATTEWETWTVKEDVGCDYFTMDPSQDLLVLMESSASFTGSGAAEAALHLCSLKTGATHPLAGNSTFYVSFDALSPHRLRCEGQIVDDHVGIFYSDDDLTNPGFAKPVVVWNWKTGEKILEIISDSFFSFCFMDESHILVASSDSYIEDDVCACIWVYDLTNHTSSRTYLTEATYHCAFLLPRSSWVDTVYVRCNPSPLYSSVLSYSSIEDLPDSIVTICEYCQVDEGSQLEDSPLYDDNDPEAVVQIFVPASRLRARMSTAMPQRRFLWVEWGPTDAHIELDTRPTDMETRIDTVSGMRAVDHEIDFTQLFVYDFEPLRVGRHHAANAGALETSEDGAAGGSVGPVRMSWDERAKEMFPCGHEGEYDFLKGLPGLASSVKLPRALWGLDWQTYNSLITDDAVVILNVRRPDSIHVLRF